MPSTYTLNNGIELIATGEQSGTWGDTTNTNFELLDTSLDGQVTVTLASTGSSGSPNTLPVSDGAASNGRNRLVIFDDSSDLGGTAFVQLTPSDAEKIIYVRNSLSGSRSILLFQGTYNASNDYEVPAGTTAVVFFDGAGAGAVAANVFNNAYFDSLRLGSVSVTEIIDDDTMATASATNIATSESIKAYVDTQVGANNELSEVLANGNTTGGTDISVSSGDDIVATTLTVADSSKAIFGAGSDLQIYHDSSSGQSIIHENGPSVFKIRATDLRLSNSANTADYLSANDGAEVSIRYNGAVKLATTSTGIDVTGTVTADGLTVDGSTTFNSTVTIGSSSYFISNATNGFRFNNSGDTAQLLYIKDTGEAVFNENGIDYDFRVESDSQSNAFLVDASTGEITTNTYGFNIYNYDDGPNLNVSSARDYNSLVMGAAANYGSNNSAENKWSWNWRGRGSGSTQHYNYFYDEIGNQEYFRVQADASQYAVVVNDGSHDHDFRVESDSNTHALFVDAGNSQVVVGTSSPITGVGAVMTIGGLSDTRLAIDGSSSAGLYLTDSGAQGITIRNASGDLEFYGVATREIVFNEGGIDTDFRVEGSGNANALFVDGGSLTASVSVGNTGNAWTNTFDGVLQIGSRGVGFLANYDKSAGNYQTIVGTGVYYDAGYKALYADAGYAYWNIAGSQTSLSLAPATTVGAAPTFRDVVTFYEDGRGTVFNDGGHDDDFRVESQTSTHTLFVDASGGTVGINTSSSAATALNISGVNNDTYGQARIAVSGSADAQMTFATASNGRGFYIDESDSNAFKLYGGGGKGVSEFIIDNTGNVTINGSLSKSSGSFRIPHPVASKTETHDLIHSFVEAPQADNIYRGKVDLVTGQATANIDTVAGMTEGTFVLLNREIQCFTSNETGWTAVRGSVSGNILTIEAQDNTCTDTVSWLVIGERQDQHMYDTEWTDDNGKVIVEPLKV